MKRSHCDERTGSAAGSRGGGVPEGASDPGLTEKQRRELEVVRCMIGIYCRGHHGSKRAELCAECRELADYVAQRVARCPMADSKTFCSSCPIHCYRPAMRERIRAVMRYAGPRMLLVSPIKALAHAVDTLRERTRGGKGRA
ncbi:nitrous oxide-stimulated promoter family protein [Berryella intestinalis]|uniref:nitrous oxide-stimulated promoter family protein n=1 Tax=Berryella intestinalis TaxID=1531429 RepID=UPI0009E39D75|nr:nitrous oxide-stimulated promoter family protein [Berryella intestinalis]